MPTPPADPVSERLAASVIAALKGVTTANDYTCTLVDPHRATASLDEGSPVDLGTTVWQHEVRSDKAGTAPYGQAEWSHIFEVAVWLRLSATDPTPVGRRINLVRADVERALMADPRRGGLCFVDNEVLDPVLTEDSDAKIFGVHVLLRCQYRTLRGDPRRLAPTATNETYFQGGATLYIAPRINPFAVGRWQRYADVRAVPKLAPVTEVINDDGGGMSRPTVERYAAQAIRYEIDVGYINPDLIARQVGGSAVDTFNQSGGTYSSVPHLVAAVGGLVPLLDAAAPNGNPVFGVSAVTAVTSANGATTYAAGTDYLADPAMLQDGMLMIPAASTIPAGATVLVTFAAPAQSRPAVAAGTACAATVRARLVWTASDGTRLVHGDFDASLIATAATDAAGEPTSTKLTLNVLGDGSAAPMGRYLLPAGPMPAGF